MWEWLFNLISDDVKKVLSAKIASTVIFFIGIFVGFYYLGDWRYGTTNDNLESALKSQKENYEAQISSLKNKQDSQNNDTKLKSVTLSSNAIHLSGSGRYLISTENNEKVGHLKRIYGLSLGDKIELRSASNDIDVIVEPTNYLKMQALFHLNNKYDKISFTCDGNDICVEDYRASNWRERDNE
ncbi:MAG: hypothetical protein C4B58_00345 [Deltaproteobacteria bacterium]|nr:MAG: hypothetical protein C4B58_00345 [Deltaproteobacteria bacterium]